MKRPICWGIVGHEAAKFTAETQSEARKTIRDLLVPGDTVVSGGCHLGGIDKWAIEEAERAGLTWREHLPRGRAWRFYKERNIQIATECDVAVCIVVTRLPATFTGPRFEYCYHCKTASHVKSGGCWTVHLARKLGKPGHIIEIAA